MYHIFCGSRDDIKVLSKSTSNFNHTFSDVVLVAYSGKKYIDPEYFFTCQNKIP